MSFMVRAWAQDAKFTDAIALEALERVVPLAMIQAAALDAASPTMRRRKLLLLAASGSSRSSLFP